MSRQKLLDLASDPKTEKPKPNFISVRTISQKCSEWAESARKGKKFKIMHTRQISAQSVNKWGEKVNKTWKNMEKVMKYECKLTLGNNIKNFHIYI